MKVCLAFLIICHIGIASAGLNSQSESHSQYVQAAGMLSTTGFSAFQSALQTLEEVVKKFELVLSIILFIITIICNFFHQKKAAIDSKRFDFARKICQVVQLGSNNDLQSSKLEDGKVIYLSNKATTKIQMQIPIIKIKMPNLFKIVQRVETVEWNARTFNCYGEKVSLQWVNENNPVVYDKFNNPLSWAFTSATYYNPSVFLGQHHLNKQIMDECLKKKVLKPKQYAHILHGIADYGERILSFDDQYIYLTPKGNLKDGKLSQTLGTQRIIIEIYQTTNISFVSKYQSGKFVKFCIKQEQKEKQAVKDKIANQNEQNQSDIIGDIEPIVRINKIIQPDEEMFKLYQKRLTKAQFFNRVSRKRILINIGIRLLLILMITAALFMSLMAVPTLKGNIPGYGPIISLNLFNQIGVCFLFGAFVILIMALVIWIIYYRSVTIIFITIFLFLDITIIILILILHKNASESQGLKVQLPHMMIMNRF